MADRQPSVAITPSPHSPAPQLLLEHRQGPDEGPLNAGISRDREVLDSTLCLAPCHGGRPAPGPRPWSHALRGSRRLQLGRLLPAPCSCPFICCKLPPLVVPRGGAGPTTGPRPARGSTSAGEPSGDEASVTVSLSPPPLLLQGVVALGHLHDVGVGQHENPDHDGRKRDDFDGRGDDPRSDGLPKSHLGCRLG